MQSAYICFLSWAEPWACATLEIHHFHRLLYLLYRIFGWHSSLHSSVLLVNDIGLKKGVLRVAFQHTVPTVVTVPLGLRRSIHTERSSSWTVEGFLSAFLRNLWNRSYFPCLWQKGNLTLLWQVPVVVISISKPMLASWLLQALFASTRCTFQSLLAAGDHHSECLALSLPFHP